MPNLHKARKAQRPEVSAGIKPSHRVFVSEVIKNGSNATRAYLKAYPNASYSSARSEGSRLLAKPNTQRAIIEAMRITGVTEESVSEQLSKMLASGDPWSVDRVCQHARAIYGWDAPKESHLTVDKRSIEIKVDAQSAKLLLEELIRQSK